MSNNFNFHIFFNVKSPMRKDSISFLDIKLNACDALRMRSGNVMLEMIQRELVKSLNAPFKCPLKKAPQRSYEFKFYNFTCTPYTKIFSIFECNVTEAKEQLFLISGRFRLTKIMSNNFNFHMFFKVKSHMRKEYINFIDIKVNACDVMRSGAGNHMLEMIRRGVVKSLNAPFKCPFKKIPNRRFDLKLHNLTCTPIGKAMSIFECEFKKLAENNYLVLARIMFSKDMTKILNFHVFLNIRSRLKIGTINFLNITANGCDILTTANGHQLLEKILKEVRRKLNVSFKCPFKENYLYEFRNFSLTDGFVPPFMPFVNFTFGLDYYDSTTLIGTTRALGEIVPKVKRQKY
ncbi:hypothetical protein FF38_11366 [Lucilia cuprina]|uniref:Uncharacterized protein n=1 Tax=Lucilia cuprina TaxID=7375 RepID=A0A0L0C3C7_LUCCU|nr:hypothetical protein FF38_11366 [Lucilia cuprina]